MAVLTLKIERLQSMGPFKGDGHTAAELGSLKGESEALEKSIHREELRTSFPAAEF